MLSEEDLLDPGITVLVGDGDRLLMLIESLVEVDASVFPSPAAPSTWAISKSISGDSDFSAANSWLVSELYGELLRPGD